MVRRAGASAGASSSTTTTRRRKTKRTNDNEAGPHFSEVERMLQDLQQPLRARKSGTQCAGNEELVKGLVQLRDGCVARQADNLVHNYSRGISAVKQCPFLIESGEQAKQLRGIGNFLANKIQQLVLRIRGSDSRPSSSASDLIHNRSVNLLAPSVHPDQLYLPVVEKVPWYMLKGLYTANATDGPRAITVERLIFEMRLLGFLEQDVKVKRNMPKLMKEHRVVAKAGSAFHLTERGQASVEKLFKVKKRSQAKKKASQTPPPAKDKPASSLLASPCSSVASQPYSSSNDEFTLSQSRLTSRTSAAAASKSVQPRNLSEFLQQQQNGRQGSPTAKKRKTKSATQISSGLSINQSSQNQTTNGFVTIIDSSDEEDEEQEQYNIQSRKSMSRSVSSSSFSSSSVARSGNTSSSTVNDRNVAPTSSRVPSAAPAPIARSRVRTEESQNTENDNSDLPSQVQMVTVATAFAPLLEPFAQPPAAGTYQSPNQVALGTDEWEVVMLLDHREKVSRNEDSLIHSKLMQLGVNFDVRSLNIGDILWAVRRYRRCGDQVLMEEFVLDVIIERKTINDLCISIVDKRYVEQKDRLEKCGVETVIYLVEGYTRSSQAGMGQTRASSITTALAITQVHSNFLIQHCHTIDETVAFLAQVHETLVQQFPASKCRNVTTRIDSSVGIPASKFNPWSFLPKACRTYGSFNQEFSKSQKLTVGDIYQMMLLQTPQFSARKSIAVAEVYPTFLELYQAYESLPNSKEKERLVQDITTSGGAQRRIGPKASANLAQVFTSIL